MTTTENKKKKRKPADMAQTRATQAAYPTDDHKRMAIRAIMQRMADHPDRSVEDISTVDFRITNQSRQTWIRKLGMKAEWDARCTALAEFRTTGYRFSKHQQAIILRRVIDGWTCGGAENMTWAQALEKHAPEINQATFYEWVEEWPTFQDQIKGAKLIRNHFGDQTPPHCHAEIEFAAGFIEADFPKMMAVLGLYIEPMQVEVDAPKRLGDGNKVNGTAWYTRDQCLQKVGLDPRAFFYLTTTNGPFREAWLACSAQREANMRDARNGIKADLKVRFDDALLSAMTKGVVVRSETVTVTATDRWGNKAGETVTAKETIREEVDPKLLPYVAKLIGEAPTDRVEVDHRHIVYGDVVHADVSELGEQTMEVLEVLQERKRLAKSEALGFEDVGETQWAEEPEGEWEPEV